MTEKRSITLNTEIIKRIEKLAKEESRSFSNMIQRILKEYFEKEIWHERRKRALDRQAKEMLDKTTKELKNKGIKE